MHLISASAGATANVMPGPFLCSLAATGSGTSGSSGVDYDQAQPSSSSIANVLDRVASPGSSAANQALWHNIR